MSQPLPRQRLSTACSSHRASQKARQARYWPARPNSLTLRSPASALRLKPASPPLTPERQMGDVVAVVAAVACVGYQVWMRLISPNWASLTGNVSLADVLTIGTGVLVVVWGLREQLWRTVTLPFRVLELESIGPQLQQDLAQLRQGQAQLRQGQAQLRRDFKEGQDELGKKLGDKLDSYIAIQQERNTLLVQSIAQVQARVSGAGLAGPAAGGGGQRWRFRGGKRGGKRG